MAKLARAPSWTAPGVRAGAVFRTKAKRGWRRIRIRSVEPNPPRVSVRRIDGEGRVLRGRFTTGALAGCRRGDPFDVYLTFRDGRWAMPVGYDPEPAT